MRVVILLSTAMQRVALFSYVPKIKYQKYFQGNLNGDDDDKRWLGLDNG